MTEKTQQEIFAELDAEKREHQRDDFHALVDMEAALERVVAHMLKRNNTYSPRQPYVDPRRAAIAKTHFEEGFRALYLGLGARLEF